jgi:hypothetical protein
MAAFISGQRWDGARAFGRVEGRLYSLDGFEFAYKNSTFGRLYQGSEALSTSVVINLRQVLKNVPASHSASANGDGLLSPV